MNFISSIVSRTTGGIVGGSTGATLLTGLGLVVGGPPCAAILFGIGTVGGTAGGAMVGTKLMESVGDKNNE